MRIDAVRVQNFAGIPDFELEGLANQSEVVVAGRNGVGKSQLLLAITAAWRTTHAHDMFRYIGPYGSETNVEVQSVLSELEREELQFLADDANHDLPILPTRVHSTLRFDRGGTFLREQADEVGNDLTFLLAQAELTKREPLARVTYLPADRHVARSPQTNLALQALGRERAREVIDEVLSQAVSEWYQPHQFDVFDSLIGLHYAGFLEQQSSGRTDFFSDFEDIVEAFEAATGKRITRPVLTAEGTVALTVELPDSTSHAVSMLSSGEMMALQLLHFVKLHVRQGAVLLVDEPEQHLHPSLQSLIATAARQSTGEGQVWFVTHSPSILAASGGKSLYLAARDQTGTSRLEPISSDESRLAVFDELGVSAGLWVPGNFLFVVEGPSDEAILRKLLPTETARAYFIVAGGSSAVASQAHRLGADSVVPFMALLDRDLGSDEQREKWNEDAHRFMWSRYSLESMLLEPELIARLLSQHDSDWTLERVGSEIERVVELQRRRILPRWLERVVTAEFPSDDDHRRPRAENYREAARTASARADFLDREGERLEAEFESEWIEGKLTMVEPKRALRDFKHQIFANSAIFVAALTAELARRPEQFPKDLVDLRTRIRSL